MLINLETIFEGLASKRWATVERADMDLLDELRAFGVPIDGTRAVLDQDIELLDCDSIRERLDERARAWLVELSALAHIGSTNTALMERAAAGPIAGNVLMAEVQTAGRGRRGRDWLSPFGRNLALSLGVCIDRSPSELGALSLVTGVALADALTTFGMKDVELKWPNDVLINRRKLCGILIELPRAVEPAEVVIGIGINVGALASVRPRVDQAIADVWEQVPDASRNALAALVISSILDYCRQFEQDGFNRIKPAYDALHQLQGDTVQLSTVNGKISGVIVGVSLEGSLMLDTESGVREFSGGEVSLRG
jgi:BirA family biotin operon repressor/biotin-[acetyl-CoA-carboxylase] ligase